MPLAQFAALIGSVLLAAALTVAVAASVPAPEGSLAVILTVTLVAALALRWRR